MSDVMLCGILRMPPELWEGELSLMQIQSAAKEAATELELRADQIDRLEESLHRIEQWSQAYPLSVFPEPDLKKAAAVLKANGMTLDAISAHAMRHVVEGVGKIAREALSGRQ